VGVLDGLLQFVGRKRVLRGLRDEQGRQQDQQKSGIE